jgi:hypothetical protein
MNEREELIAYWTNSLKGLGEPLPETRINAVERTIAALRQQQGEPINATLDPSYVVTGGHVVKP